MEDTDFDLLARIVVIQDHLKETELMAIKLLRSQGHGIPSIATAMGLSRQTLRKRLITGYYGVVVPTDRASTYDKTDQPAEGAS